MDRVALDGGTQLGSQRLLGHQIDRATQQVFKIELEAEIARRVGRAIEGDQEVGIAVFARVLSSRTKLVAPHRNGVAVPACVASRG